MTTKRQLWIDTQGQPVVTTTPNGERNAARWGWIRAVAITKVEYDLLAPDLTGHDEWDELARVLCDAHRGDGCKSWDDEEQAWRDTYRDMADAVLAAGYHRTPRPVTVTDEAVETARREEVAAERWMGHCKRAEAERDAALAVIERVRKRAELLAGADGEPVSGDDLTALIYANRYGREFLALLPDTPTTDRSTT